VIHVVFAAALAAGEPERPGIEEALAAAAAPREALGGTLRLGGTFAADGILRDRRNAGHSGLETGAIRPRADLRWGEAWALLVEADLLGDASPHPLAEARATWRPATAWRFEAGYLPLALGTEAATREPDLPAVGRGFTSWLAARTDVAARAVAAPGEALRVEAFAAAGHGHALDGRARTSPMIAGRAVVRPGVLGAFLGAGAAHLADFDDPVDLRAPLRSTVFHTGDLGGSGGRWLLAEGGFAAGPVAAGLEVLRGVARGVRDPGGGTFTADEITAWTGSVALSLTGEERPWRDGRWERPEARGGGAWEVAIRYSNGDVDRALFDEGVTTYDPSTQEVRTFSAVLGWRPFPGGRVALGWTKTIADDALSVFDGNGPSAVPRVSGGNRDSSFVLRLEVDF
jgi:hypothetical protein